MGTLELDCACQEDTNLENFFTEHLVYMGGTLFWGSKFHSQVWHILVTMETTGPDMSVELQGKVLTLTDTLKMYFRHD